MNKLPEIFKKYTTQLWYIFLTPVIFAVIMGAYRPFGNPAALTIGKSIFVFNVSMIMCIIMVFLFITRHALYFLRKFLCRNWWQFLGWALFEFTGVTFYIAMYITLMGHEGSYFLNLALSLQYSFLTMVVPYFGITAVLEIIHLLSPDAVETESVKLTDKNGNVKIVLLKESILFIKADENYITVYYKSGDKVKDYTLRSSMTAITPLANSFGLFRCQRSYFVNPSHIIALRRDAYDIYSAEMSVSGLVVPVSKSKYQELSRLL